MATPNTPPSVTNFRFAPRKDMQKLYELQLDAYQAHQTAIGELGENYNPVQLQAIINQYNERIAPGLDLEHTVGKKLSVVPSAYVVRALGECRESIIHSWQTVCGQIEMFRHYNGVSDPNIVLGPAAEEEWLEYARQRYITGIVRLQLSQVMVSDKPDDTIRYFGLDTVKSDCGLPPKLPLADSRSQQWVEDAFGSYIDSWPPDDVLALDEYASERW